MSLHIAGCGWVTPLGAELDLVWQKLMNGESGEIKMEKNPETGTLHPVMPVPQNLVEHISRIPRLRRSSPISYFSVAAGLSALENAGVKMDAETAARTAVVFAVSNGAVVYTRRFYEQIVKGGANTASPMLFPETVYNAPASHLAAQLGIDGPSYTLVGDATVGITALGFAQQLLETGDIDRCVVVGAEEIDWILCEAHHAWRLSESRPEMKVFSSHAGGTVLSEGSCAVVLAKSGPVKLERIHAGIPFTRRKEALPALTRVIQDLCADAKPDAVVCSANGTFVDSSEATALTASANFNRVYAPKPALGEAIGAGSLMQVITGTLALQKGQLPVTRGESGIRKGDSAPLNRILVSCLGFNQQASGLLLSL